MRLRAWRACKSRRNYKFLRLHSKRGGSIGKPIRPVVAWNVHRGIANHEKGLQFSPVYLIAFLDAVAD
jgi:hypothetical protein